MNNAVHLTRGRSLWVAILATFAMIAGVMAPVFGVATAANAADPDFKVLVFNETAGFVHPEIGTATTTIQNLGAANNFAVDVAATSTNVFTEANLAQYDAVIWNSTTGDVLNSTEEAAFKAYIEGGGGYVGLHSASDTEHSWTWYKETLVGGEFNNHPNGTPTATIKVEDATNESTKHLTSDTWTRTDEWYNFVASTFKRANIHVLLSMDETSYAPGSGAMPADHPIAWCQDRKIGSTSLRSWYTALGHTNASYSEPAFVSHLLGGIKIGAGQLPSGCGASQSSSYDFVTLDDNTSNPMAMDVAPDGRVFYAERDGRLRQIDPVTNVTSTAMTLPVTQANEDGFLGVVVDPNFATNGWIYLYYAPSNTGTDGPHNRIGRFTYDFTTKTASLSSEVSVLKITTQRNRCCHMGGDMVFDSNGNLILAVGDNTDPFESGGYSPIDERSGRQDFDAQRTSGNTNDLRGKIVRIHPEPNGTYTIPAGNLFAPGTALTRPEIYAMGFRNPFRIGVDPQTNNIIVGDYGPDAGSDSATRGPRGGVEWNVLSQPGNYGWPYCQGKIGPNNNGCYIDYNFANSTSGTAFNPNALVNDSPNNTGLTNLPPVIQPSISYPNSGNTTASIGAKAVLEIGGGGGAPMGGPVYRYDENLASSTKWPKYWDGKGLLGEWNQGTMYSVQLDRTNSSSVVDINQILPAIFDNGSSNGLFRRAMDFEWGPDGAMYVVDWGSGFNGNNSDSGVYRVDYTQGSVSPIARAAADVTNTAASTLAVNFSSAGSSHPFGYPITYSWNFGDGTAASTAANPSHTYTAPGSYNAQLTVTDNQGGHAIANVTIVVGNAAPTLSINFPENGGFFEWGDQVRYEVTVNDPDGAVDCSRVSVLGGLGHDTHNHDYGQLFGCSGWLQTARDAGHGLEANLFWVVNASYTDAGGVANVPTTGYATNIMNPTTLQAEYYKTTGQIGNSAGTGVSLETTADTLGGGSNLTSIDVNDFWGHRPVNLVNMTSVDLRLAATAGGTIQARFGTGANPDPATAPVIGTLNYTATGGASTYQYQRLNFTTVPTGEGTLFFVNTAGTTAKLNYYQFNGDGVQSNTAPTATLQVDKTTGIAPTQVTANLLNVVDPDGASGAPVTIEWDTGAGYQAGTATKVVSYATPGTYVIRAKLTDAGGAYRELEQSIQVTAAVAGVCFAGRSDGFDGTALDEKWNRNVRQNQTISVANGKLTIPAAIGDLYQTSTPASANLVLQDMPSGNFSAITKVTIPARIGYQQAGLLIYGDDDNYVKLMLQARTGDSTPSAETRVVQMAKETAGTASETNSPSLTAAFPDTAYLRIDVSGTTATGFYSADGTTWTQITTTRDIASITNPKIGVWASASTSTQAQAAAIINAEFDWFTITPDATAVAPSPNDTFDGTKLDPCRWTITNEDANLYRVQNGNLELDTTVADIYGTGGSIPNVVLQNQPAGDWTMETKVDTSAFDRQYQNAGLVVYTDAENYMKWDIVTTNAAGSTIARNYEFRHEIAGVVQSPQNNVTATAGGGIGWLRLAKVGSTFTASYSTNGTTWTAFTNTFTDATLAANAKIGVYTLGSTSAGTAGKTAKFDSFSLTSASALAVNATTSPATADGTNGWFKQNVNVTLASTGGGSGTKVIEYNLNGGAWTTYTAPFAVTTEGTTAVNYRVTEGTGTPTSAQTLSIKIDKTVPTVAGALVVNPSNAEDRTLTITGTDAGSGIGSLQYSNNAGVSWTTYTAPVALPLAGGSYQVRSTDAAGNLSAVSTVEVPTIGSCGVVGKDDAFDGTSLDKCRWTVVAENTALYRVQNGSLEIDTTAADIYGTGGAIPNVIVQDQPSGNWTIETKVDGSAFDQRYKNAGLIVYVDADNYLKFDLNTTNATGSAVVRALEFRSEVAGTVANPQNNVAVTASTVWLRISKGAGDVYTASYSTNGTTWTNFTNTYTNAAVANGKVGLYTLGSTQSGHVTKTAKFDYFDVVDTQTVTATVSPAAPTGANSWYTGPVTTTVTAQGGSPALADSIEVGVDGAALGAYTAPVVVSTDGQHTVQYRALDGTTATATQSATFKIDATKPTVTPSLVVDSGDASVRSLSIVASDATSGVASIEYSSNAGVSWTTYTSAVSLTSAAQTFQVRATDNAGNVADVVPLSVPAYCTPVVGLNDDFTGSALNECRWSVVNKDASKYRVAGGVLEIDTTAADIYGTGGSIPNVMLQTAPSGNWTIETKVDGSAFDQRYKNAGLIVYVDADNYLKFDLNTTNATGSAVVRALEFRSEVAGTVANPQNNVAVTASTVWLRISKGAGDVYTASYSTNGTTWTNFTNTYTNAAVANGKVGLYTLGSTQSGHVTKTAKFDYFYQIEALSAAATVSPAAPNGQNGWYTSPVTTTVTSSGGSPAVSETVETNLDSAGYVAYTAPVAVSADGTHSLLYRASEAGSTTTTPQTVSFKIDATKPTATASLTDRTVTITGADATSGVASIEYKLTGETAWTAYTAPIVLGNAGTTVTYRSTDAAGNVSTEGSQVVPEVVVEPGDVTVDRVAGASRFETAVEISKKAYPGTAPVVYVANGNNYPDALSAGPAAAHEGGPLLLVTPESIPGVVATELARLDPARIVVVGGIPSVNAAVFTQLQGMADTVDRVAGADRYETSRLLVDYAFGDEGSTFAYVSTGLKFPDALAAGGAAGSKDAPVILVNGAASDLDAATVTLLGDLGVTDTRVLGGADTVSAGIFDDVDAVTNAVRLAGSDRYQTARAINADAFDTADHAFLVTGVNYPDALAGSAWAGAEGAPVFASTQGCVPGGVLDDLEALGVTHVTLLGGEPSLSAAVYALTRC